MKLDEISIEYKDRVEFACKVCRVYHKSITGRESGCAWKKGDEVCVDIERAIAEMEAEKVSGYDVCDACGQYPKQPNSMLCKLCEDKAGG